MFLYGKRVKVPGTRGGGKKPAGGGSGGKKPAGGGGKKPAGEGAIRKPPKTSRVVIFEAGRDADTPEKTRAAESIYRLMFGDDEHVPMSMVWIFPQDPTRPPSDSNPLNMSKEYELVINDATHLGRGIVRVLAVKYVKDDPNLEGKGNKTIKFEGNTGVRSPQNPNVSLPYLSIKVFDQSTGRSSKKHYGVITSWSGNGQAPPSPPREGGGGAGAPPGSPTNSTEMVAALDFGRKRRKVNKLSIKRLRADLKRLAKC